MNIANTLNRLSSVEYGDNGLKFGRVHNKVENIWASLHPLQEGESVADLGDYSLVSTDAEIEVALKEGFKEAQAMLQVLNMAPNIHASAAKKLWFRLALATGETRPFSFGLPTSSNSIAEIGW